MAANGFVYDLTLGILVPKLSVISTVDLPLVNGYYYRAGGSLIQPGSRSATGEQILSYGAEFIAEGVSLRILEFSYE